MENTAVNSPFIPFSSYPIILQCPSTHSLRPFFFLITYRKCTYNDFYAVVQMHLQPNHHYFVLLHIPHSNIKHEYELSSLNCIQFRPLLYCTNQHRWQRLNNSRVQFYPGSIPRSAPTNATMGEGEFRPRIYIFCAGLHLNSILEMVFIAEML